MCVGEGAGEGEGEGVEVVHISYIERRRLQDCLSPS